MKKNIILILTTFSLSGCAPKFKVVERCSISFAFNKCRCHEYDINEVRRVSDAYDMPLEYCEDLTGFSVEAWAKEITPKAKKLLRWGRDNCKTK